LKRFLQLADDLLEISGPVGLDDVDRERGVPVNMYALFARVAFGAGAAGAA
jgi:hypothetical protein